MKKSLSPKDKDYCHAEVLFDTIRTEKNVNELILLYTLETSFYKALQENVDSFAIELYSCLSSLQERAFKSGITYRGLTMNEDAIKDYRWAAKDKGRMIEIKTMTSTSQLDRVAIRFATDAKAKEGGNKHCVLYVFKFSDICYTAIDLNKGGTITKYEEEEEVLLLPGTLFEVQAVTNGPQDDWYTIQLKNIPVPYKILMKSLNELKTA